MQSKNDLIWLLLRLKPLRWRISLGLTFVSLAGLVITIDPLLMQILIDRALPSHNFQLASKLVAGITACLFGRVILYDLGSMVNFSVGQRCVRSLRIDLFEQMNRLSVSYHEHTPTGEKVTLMEHDTEEIANFGADTTDQSIRAVLSLAVNLAIMAKLNMSMTLILVPLLPLFGVIQRRFNHTLKIKAEAVRTEMGATNSLLTEHLAAIPQIQFLGAQRTSIQKAIALWESLLRTQWEQRQADIAFGIAMTAILVGAISVVLAVGSAKQLNGSLTLGGLIAFYTYAARIFEPISSATELYARLRSVGASIHRVKEVLLLEPTVSDFGLMQTTSHPSKYELSLEGVFFAYESKPVLKGITVAIGPNESIAIIGPSGSGKSTLARLLVRAIDPVRGQILLGGSSLREYTLASLRSTICYVPQHPILFQGTIRENLLYANSDASDDELYRALEAAQFSATLEKLPQKLQTVLGPGAVDLSGGERQRLAIARSLLRNSDVLVCDESTSALDAPTEHSVLSGIVQYRHQQTLVLISHRVSSLSWVDRLVLLDGGEVVASGSHKDLYANSTLYRQLYDESRKDFSS